MNVIETAKQETLSQPRAGYVLYDGGCGFCFRWVHLWKRVIERRGFALKDLQSSWADGTLPIERDRLLDDILVLTRSGDIVSGADAYLHVTRQIWWAWPFFAIFSQPGFNWVLWRGYRWFNQNRYRISGHCSLPRRGPEPPNS